MLNVAQQRAVDHHHGPLLVIAGAGTGKTRTLTHRFARLIAQGAAPERILLLTFTRKAANEMQERAEKLLIEQGHSLNHLQIGGTFHATAFRWLYRLQKVASGFSIVDDSDMKKLIKSQLTEDEGMILTHAGLSVGDLMQIQGLKVNMMSSTQKVIDRFFPQALNYHEEIDLLMAKIHQRKKRDGLFDYDDILSEWLKLLQSAGGDTVRRAYDFVMVDEYQDTSTIQVEILKELVRDHHNLMAVGDDCQSIYSFRGALADQMKNFSKDFDQAEVIKLEDNYRSCQPILDFCNNVIAESVEVFPKELQSANGRGGHYPLLVSGKNVFDVSFKIMQRIYENVSNGIPLNEQAVLYRSSQHVLALEKKLIEQNIPYTKYGGQKITEAAHVRDFMAILSCCYTFSPTAWMRVLQLLAGIGQKTSEKIIDSLRSGVIDHSLFPKKCRQKLTELCELIDQENDDSPDPQLLEECLNWYGEILHRKYEKSHNRYFELQELCNHILNVDSISEFAAQILLDHADPEEDEFDSRLILSTIHSAKGKEWDCVYIANVADGAIPLNRPTCHPEEERRLLYVAMTRARQQLYLYWPQHDDIKMTDNQCSPFLQILNPNVKNASLDPYMLKTKDHPDDLLYVYGESDTF